MQKCCNSNKSYNLLRAAWQVIFITFLQKRKKYILPIQLVESPYVIHQSSPSMQCRSLQAKNQCSHNDGNDQNLCQQNVDTAFVQSTSIFQPSSLSILTFVLYWYFHQISAFYQVLNSRYLKSAQYSRHTALMG